MRRHTLRRHTPTRSTALLVTTLVLAGCGDRNGNNGGTGPDWPEGCRITEVCSGAEISEVTAAVSGDVNEPVSGGAVFAEEADGSWLLSMGTDYEGESGIFFIGYDGRPAAGKHAFDATSAELRAFYVHGESDGFYVAEVGELTVTQSSSSGVAGDFAFTASDEQGNVVTVEGTFNALSEQDEGITIEATSYRQKVGER